jgi:endonuclease YncB( thermonuclease family)
VLLTIAIILVGWNSILPVARTYRSGGAIVGYARVIDGDTLDLSGARIRLRGIDAPEATQTCTIAEQVYRCGERATQALADLIRGQALRCDPLGLDQYRRTIGRCKIIALASTSDPRWVRQGYAVAYTRYSCAYVHDELVARISGRGLWAGTFEWPWVYRHEARDRR